MNYSIRFKIPNIRTAQETPHTIPYIIAIRLIITTTYSIKTQITKTNVPLNGTALKRITHTQASEQAIVGLFGII